MAIRFRRGKESDLDLTRLLAGEPAFCTDTKKLYVSNGDNTVEEAMLKDKYAAGTGAANVNEVDHAIFADTSGNVAQQLDIIDGNFQIMSTGDVVGTQHQVYGYPIWDLWITDHLNSGYQAWGKITPFGSVPGSFNYARLGWTTSTFSSWIKQVIENGVLGLCSYPQLTLSFYAKASEPGVQLEPNLHLDFGTGGSSYVEVYSTDPIISASWKRYSVTFNMPIISNKIISMDNILMIGFALVSHENTNVASSGYVDLTQVQLDIGSVALPYRYKSFEQELRSCQRYYEQSYNYGTAPGASWADQGAVSAYSCVTYGLMDMGSYKVTKRVTPTVSVYSSRTGTKNAAFRFGPFTDFTGVSVDVAGTTRVGRLVYSSGSLPVDNYFFHWTADARY